jgi:hypothetical protein
MFPESHDSESHDPELHYTKWYERFKEALQRIHVKELMWLAKEAVSTHVFSNTSIS